ncbi:MAG: hypothetical protein APF78_02055 [Sphingomonadales bacterium BRH_c3]|nr:MAG: hypothetical protein APF78_02055 [Sphingomonadales bacterium BRH_c3]
MIAALILALALAMDAFAVALTQGARFRPHALGAVQIALAFGVAQGVMPLIGWVIGAYALQFVAAWDHWIAFALLAFLGLRMIFAGEHQDEALKLSGAALFMASIATSVDALAAGITLPTLDIAPLPAAALIAGVTFALSLVGVVLGRRAGDRFGRTAEIAGGVILIALGCKILVEHTGIV